MLPLTVARLLVSVQRWAKYRGDAAGTLYCKGYFTPEGTVFSEDTECPQVRKEQSCLSVLVLPCAGSRRHCCVFEIHRSSMLFTCCYTSLAQPPTFRLALSCPSSTYILLYNNMYVVCI